MTVSDVKESMKNSGRHVSMDAPLIEGEDSNLYDVLNSGESPNPDKSLLHESLKVEILRALETLTPREADVVKLYFGLGDAHPMTLEEIGETFDLTRERVIQIKENQVIYYRAGVQPNFWVADALTFVEYPEPNYAYTTISELTYVTLNQ